MTIWTVWPTQATKDECRHVCRRLIWYGQWRWAKGERLQLPDMEVWKQSFDAEVDAKGKDPITRPEVEWVRKAKRSARRVIWDLRREVGRPFRSDVVLDEFVDPNAIEAWIDWSLGSNQTTTRILPDPLDANAYPQGCLLIGPGPSAAATDAARYTNAFRVMIFSAYLYPSLADRWSPHAIVLADALLVASPSEAGRESRVALERAFQLGCSVYTTSRAGGFISNLFPNHRDKIVMLSIEDPAGPLESQDRGNVLLSLGAPLAVKLSGQATFIGLDSSLNGKDDHGAHKHTSKSKGNWRSLALRAEHPLAGLSQNYRSRQKASMQAFLSACQERGYSISDSDGPIPTVATSTAAALVTSPKDTKMPSKLTQLVFGGFHFIDRTAGGWVYLPCLFALILVTLGALAMESIILMIAVQLIIAGLLYLVLRRRQNRMAVELRRELATRTADLAALMATSAKDEDKR